MSAVAVLVPVVGVFAVQVTLVKTPRLPCSGVVPSVNVRGQLFSMSVAVTVIVTGLLTVVVADFSTAVGGSFTQVMLTVAVAALEVWTPSLVVYLNEPSLG